jgi:predicted dehydrogenase
MPATTGGVGVHPRVRPARDASTAPPVRYAVVGLGHIAQTAVLPAFANARFNSELTALVSDDPVKRRQLARRYRVAHTYRYRQFEECLEEVDCVYLALPNSLHAQYAIRAAEAGVHVLCEKPLAVTVGECDGIIDACRANDVRLMVAYRLHFEPLTLGVIDLVRSGRLGDVKYITSAFGMRIRAGDIRLDPALGGGALYDLGVYCINTARALFRAEPTEVSAFSVRGRSRRLNGVDETTAAILRFGDERVATFITSFKSADVSTYRVVGTKGVVVVDPAYSQSKPLACQITVGARTETRRGVRHDQFGPQLLYFSRCVQGHHRPEPSGEEGREDVRIVEALYESARIGRPVSVRPRHDDVRPSGAQAIVRPGRERPRPIHARAPRQK